MSTGTSCQHPELGSVALRLLWIPAVASVVIVGYLILRTPSGDLAPSSVHAMTAVVPEASPPEPPKAPGVPSTQPDAAIAAHELLDPVGAGHDVAR